MTRVLNNVRYLNVILTGFLGQALTLPIRVTILMALLPLTP